MKKLLPLFLLFPLAACDEAETSTLQAVPTVDVEAYMGTWYEIANFPMRFQKGCTGTTATYAYFVLDSVSRAAAVALLFWLPSGGGLALGFFIPVISIFNNLIAFKELSYLDNLSLLSSFK